MKILISINLIGLIINILLIIFNLILIKKYPQIIKKYIKIIKEQKIKMDFLKNELNDMEEEILLS